MSWLVSSIRFDCSARRFHGASATRLPLAPSIRLTSLSSVLTPVQKPLSTCSSARFKHISIDCHEPGCLPLYA
jgi:hypothetical protein